MIKQSIIIKINKNTNISHFVIDFIYAENDLYIDENDLTIRGLRIFVQGGGCSGFQYGFTWDKEEQDDDFSFVISDKVGVLVDAISMQYLTGAVLKFKQELGGSNFVIENPNSTSKCGCGSSFAV